ncbi:MAG TPA: hypothetical protein PLA71_00485 [Saccharofermentans sp.]|nr:hypothetical protein [Saccharofermentans sp.]
MKFQEHVSTIIGNKEDISEMTFSHSTTFKVDKKDVSNMVDSLTKNIKLLNSTLAQVKSDNSIELYEFRKILSDLNKIAEKVSNYPKY